MKTPRWLFHLGFVLISLLRLLLSFLMFRRFFLFRMADVTAIFLAYLVLDSLEGVVVYYRRDIWGPIKTNIHYIIDALFLFTVISGILLRLPLLYFLTEMGKNIENNNIVEIWIACTCIVLGITILLGIAVNSVWGNIQNLGARFIFLLYCSYHLYPERAILIPLIIIAAACILGIEIKKYGWSWKELRKKDIRFRHPDPVVPPYPKQHKPPLS